MTTATLAALMSGTARTGCREPVLAEHDDMIFDP
jgi:hypothetical protein